MLIMRILTIVCGLVVVACGSPAPATVAPPVAAASPTATPINCPSFQTLGRQVDAKVAAIKPGVTLSQFETDGIGRALNFWDPAPGGLRETVFFVSVDEGNAAVSDQVVCRFNKADVLQSCRKECCRSESRTMSAAVYESLKIGDDRSAVEERACSPSATERKGQQRTTYYHVPLPVDHHDEGQTAMLVFKQDKLASKNMSPYY